MDKPTIFFSHSSKNNATIMPIKQKLVEITANVLDIFMSSDGQSIPFGNNWVHKIEEGLDNAQIMFVFVTPNSINSAWIYFEAGFAYSKHIQVVPVGIGINVGELKPPLNLLQGFDITSADSLNNLVSIINRKFNLGFKEAFTDIEYNAVFDIITNSDTKEHISDIFDDASYILHSQYCDSSDRTKILRYDVDECFEKIKRYLYDNNIQYSSRDKVILVLGVEIEVHGTEKEPTNGIVDQNHYLRIKLSTRSFKKSFLLMQNLFPLLHEGDWFHLRFNFNKDYTCVKDSAALSAIKSSKNSVFGYIKEHTGTYSNGEFIKFWIADINKYESSRSQPKYVVGISMKIAKVKAEEIEDLIREMVSCEIIYKAVQIPEALK